MPTTTFFFLAIKQFRATVQFLCAQYVFFLPHQSSWNLFNIRKCLKEEIQFQPENCTHPGEQVVSYLINYWRLISLPDCCHMLQYWNWNSKEKRQWTVSVCLWLCVCVCKITMIKNITLNGWVKICILSFCCIFLFYKKLYLKSYYLTLEDFFVLLVLNDG